MLRSFVAVALNCFVEILLDLGFKTLVSYLRMIYNYTDILKTICFPDNIKSCPDKLAICKMYKTVLRTISRVEF